MQLLYAHTLSELKMDSAAGANLRWLAAAGRPAAVIRWGIGVQYTPERGYEGAPPELGKEPKGGEPANGAGGNPEPREGGRKRPGNKTGVATGNAAGGAEVAIPSEPLPMLRHFTGELGDKVLERLQKQISKGAYGEILKTAAASSPVADPANAGALDPANASIVNANPGQPGAVSGGKDAGLGRLSPGLVMLGRGTTKELIERANEEGLEMMLVFDVSASRTRTGKESSDTKVRIVEPVTGKDLFTTKNVNNIQLFMAREKPAGKADPLEEVVDLLLKNIEDKNCKLGEYPELTEDQVKGRYDKLLAQEFENPLPVLVELRSYFQRKKLSGALLFEAYKKFLGEEKAGVLAKGKVEEKREALAEWLPAGIKIAPASAAPAATSVTGSAAGGPGSAAVDPGVPVASPPLVAQPAAVQPGAIPPAVAQPGPGGAAGKFEIPGTTLSLPVPPGFTLGKDASGPYMINGSASIRAKREEKPMATVLRDYTAKNLELGGFTFDGLREVEIPGGPKVAMVTAVHTASKLKYMFALLPEGETATIVVSAGYSPEDEIRLAPALMSAVMTMKLGK